MYQTSNNLLDILLLKKLIKSGKQTKALKINKYMRLLFLNNTIFKKALLNIITPIKLEEKKIGSTKYTIPKLVHLYTSINIAISKLIKAAKLKNRNKLPMYKAMYMEIIDILNCQGQTYFAIKQQTIKKALISRVFLYLILNKKIKL